MNRAFPLRSESIRARVIEFIKGLACDPEHPLEVVVRTLRRPRTVDQNKRYWLIIGFIHEVTGEDRNALHEHCKAKFLGVDRHEVQGRVYEIPRSSAELNTKEFGEYMDQVEAWAVSFFGVIIDWEAPLPEPWIPSPGWTRVEDYGIPGLAEPVTTRRLPAPAR